MPYSPEKAERLKINRKLLRIQNDLSEAMLATNSKNRLAHLETAAKWIVAIIGSNIGPVPLFEEVEDTQQVISDLSDTVLYRLDNPMPQ